MPPPNSKLAIAIPTYNRAKILEENIKIMMPELRQHGIPVFISDDSSDSQTKIVVDRLRTEYANIHYQYNQPGLGHDKNFFATLGMADYDYVWYMGDSVYCEPGSLQGILNTLETGADFIFINSYAKDEHSRFIGDTHAFLLMRTWYLTLTGATIYGRRPRSLAVDDSRKACWRNFVQLGLILEYCSQRPASLYWYGTPSLGFNKRKRSYWMKSAMDVFVGDWTSLIQSFPTLFSMAEMPNVIRSHAVHTGIFGLKSLIFFRANEGLSVSIIKKHEKEYAVASPSSVSMAYVVARIPVSLLRGLLKVFHFFRELGRA
jgi:glycosyltransferase involved in cell wall biosynthesis